MNMKILSFLVAIASCIVTITSSTVPVKVYGMEGYGITLYCNPKDPTFESSQPVMWELPDQALIAPFTRDDFQILEGKVVLKGVQLLHSGVYKCKVDKHQIFTQELVIVKLSRDELFQSFDLTSPPVQVCSPESGQDPDDMAEALKQAWCRTDYLGPNAIISKSCVLQMISYSCNDDGGFSHTVQPTLPTDYVFQVQCSDLQCLLSHAKEAMNGHYLMKREQYVSHFLMRNGLPELLTERTVEDITCGAGFHQVGLFCEPCIPGFYSDQQTGYECVACKKKMYANIYGLGECVSLKQKLTGHEDYENWKPQITGNIPTIYGLEGDIEVLRCNPDVLDSVDASNIPSSISFKWKLPRDVSETANNFKQADDLLFIIPGVSSLSGTYSCTVDFGTEKTIMYKQEVIFTMKHMAPTKVYFKFPNHHCKNKEENMNRLAELDKQLNKVWAYPFKLNYNIFKLEKGDCYKPNKYKILMKIERKKDFNFLQCRSTDCLIQNVENHLQRKLKFNWNLHKQLISPYFAEAGKIIKTDYMKPPRSVALKKPCNKGFVKTATRLLCVPCRPGFYAVWNAASSLQECQECPEGKYQDQYAATLCKDCDGMVYETRSRCTVHLRSRKAQETVNVEIRSNFVASPPVVPSSSTKVVPIDYKFQDNKKSKNNCLAARSYKKLVKTYRAITYVPAVEQGPVIVITGKKVYYRKEAGKELVEKSSAAQTMTSLVIYYPLQTCDITPQSVTMASPDEQPVYYTRHFRELSVYRRTVPQYLKDLTKRYLAIGYLTQPQKALDVVYKRTPITYILKNYAKRAAVLPNQEHYFKYSLAISSLATPQGLPGNIISDMPIRYILQGKNCQTQRLVPRFSNIYLTITHVPQLQAFPRNIYTQEGIQLKYVIQSGRQNQIKEPSTALMESPLKTCLAITYVQQVQASPTNIYLQNGRELKYMFQSGRYNQLKEASSAFEQSVIKTYLAITHVSQPQASVNHIYTQKSTVLKYVFQSGRQDQLKETLTTYFRSLVKTYLAITYVAQLPASVNKIYTQEGIELKYVFHFGRQNQMKEASTAYFRSLIKTYLAITYVPQLPASVNNIYTQEGIKLKYVLQSGRQSQLKEASAAYFRNLIKMYLAITYVPQLPAFVNTICTQDGIELKYVFQCGRHYQRKEASAAYFRNLIKTYFAITYVPQLPASVKNSYGQDGIQLKYVFQSGRHDKLNNVTATIKSASSYLKQSRLTNLAASWFQKSLNIRPALTFELKPEIGLESILKRQNFHFFQVDVHREKPFKKVDGHSDEIKVKTNFSFGSKEKDTNIFTTYCVELFFHVIKCDYFQTLIDIMATIGCNFFIILCVYLIVTLSKVIVPIIKIQIVKIPNVQTEKIENEECITKQSEQEQARNNKTEEDKQLMFILESKQILDIPQVHMMQKSDKAEEKKTGEAQIKNKVNIKVKGGKDEHLMLILDGKQMLDIPKEETPEEKKDEQLMSILKAKKQLMMNEPTESLIIRKLCKNRKRNTDKQLPKTRERNEPVMGNQTAETLLGKKHSQKANRRNWEKKEATENSGTDGMPVFNVPLLLSILYPCERH